MSKGKSKGGKGRKPAAKALLAAPMLAPADPSQSGMGALQGASPAPSGLGYKRGGKVKLGGSEKAGFKKSGDSTGKFKKGGKVGKSDHDADDMKKGGKVKKYASGGAVKSTVGGFKTMPSSMKHGRNNNC